MRLQGIVLLIGLLTPALHSCRSEQTDPPTDQNQQPIVMQGYGEAVVEASTRAGTTFPNAGRIAVIADAVPEDWINLAFSNMEAVTTDVSPAVSYSYTWSSGQAQYWPLNGSGLALVAYSAKSAAIVPNGKVLNVTLPATNSTMPDLMYGSGVKYGDKSLANRSVDFGMFKHALSQLTVRLVTDQVGPPIVLSAFSITTKSKATLDLATGALVVSPATNITYSYPSAPTLANNTTYTLEAAAGVPFLVYPDVAGQNNTTIYIRFTDGANTGNVLDVEKTFNVSDFLVPIVGNPVVLERAKSSVLTITVKGTQILNLSLTGGIVPWEQKDDFGLTIE